MKVSKATLIRIIVFHIVIIYLAIVALMHTGCQVLKSKRSTRIDSTVTAQVSKAESDSSAGGSVNKTNSSSKEENEWWRKTFTFPAGRDTTINNFYPQTVVLEGGKGSKEATTSNYDSTFFTRFEKIFSDSLSEIKRSMQESNKDKESKPKGLSLINAILLMVLYFLLTQAVGWVLGKYKFQNPLVKK